MPIDTFYQELTETYGEGLFPSTVTAHSDQIHQVLATLDALPRAPAARDELLELLRPGCRKLSKTNHK